MRCVLITPFGMPVEPEVNRNLAMVSAVTRACAASAASGAASSLSSDPTITSVPSGTADAMARWYCALQA